MVSELVDATEDELQDTYSEFYLPSPEELAAYLADATVVPDANVLLGLYRLSAHEREQVLTVLNGVKDRLWIPYQVGLEYQRNRTSVIQQTAGAYENLTALPGVRTLDAMNQKLKGSQLPEDVRAEVAGELRKLTLSLVEAAKEYEDFVGGLTERHVVTTKQALADDPVREQLDELLAGRVGPPPSAEKRAERIAEGLRRSEALIPPGFKDAEKEKDEQKTGDFMLWREMLDHASSLPPGARVLFVTADTKEDWFSKASGQPTGPLPALLKEFVETCPGCGYHQVTLAEFLNLANEHLSAAVEASTIEKASDVGEAQPFSSVIDLPWARNRSTDVSWPSYYSDSRPTNDFLAQILAEQGQIPMSEVRRQLSDEPKYVEERRQHAEEERRLIEMLLSRKPPLTDSSPSVSDYLRRSGDAETPMERSARAALKKMLREQQERRSRFSDQPGTASPDDTAPPEDINE